MRLQNNDQRSSLFWLAIGLIVALYSIKYGIGTFSSPGPGLLPFLSGIAISALALVVLFQHSVNIKKEKVKDLWAQKNWSPVVIVLGVLIVYIILFKTLGFLLNTLWLIAFLLRVVEPLSWKKVLFGSILASLGSYVVFQLWLEAQLPVGIFGF